jgi:hypothetical protein
MITDVPAADDFLAYGLRFLNLGWQNALTVALELVDAHEWGGDVDEELREEFVRAAEPELGTALALVEQGVEFLLKGRIAAVSPWLLLSRDPDGWPRRSDKEDTPFAEFHTIDAQDLVRVHDTACKVRLPDEFVTIFKDLRRKRNAMTHTVDRRVKASITEIIEAVLFASHTLAGERSWATHRRQFMENDRDSKLNVDAVHYRFAREFAAVLAQLPPSMSERFIGLPNGPRIYLCPQCRHSYSDAGELECRSAVLEPNKPSSVTIRCYVCGEVQAVVRQRCVHHSDCKGNVIDLE